MLYLLNLEMKLKLKHREIDKKKKRLAGAAMGAGFSAGSQGFQQLGL